MKRRKDKKRILVIVQFWKNCGQKVVTLSFKGVKKGHNEWEDFSFFFLVVLFVSDFKVFRILST